jgi:hypothetical protein
LQSKSYITQGPRKTLSTSPFIPVIIGDTNFFINKGLKDIANAIKESKSLLNNINIVEDSTPVDLSTYINAITFLYDYSTSIFNETSSKKILATPYIDSMVNGDVYLDWKTEKANFLIIFKKDKDISYFYGETREDKIPFKSGVHNNSAVKSFLSDWFKENLCA